MAPVPSLVDEYINSNAVMIFSKTTCPYCTRVKGLFDSLGVPYFALELDTVENGDILHKALASKVGRTSVPQVFIKGRHMGGCDDVMNLHNSGKLNEFLEEKKYDYDFVVIGGGSGGLAASKEAARLGKKVAVLDFVVPTPIGTSWGLGGTCVNVGCIPKKLMHQAALHGQGFKDSKYYGWNYDESAIKHDWNSMKNNVQTYIKSLNWNYKVQLRSENVTYINAFGEFIDNHQIKAIDKKGKEKIITSNEFLIAAGERPRYPDIPGAKEFGITSDDLFSLPSSPGKTLVIGASYVALECAGFLFGIGLDVTVMVRSIFLRGFDQDMAERIGSYMVSEGIKIIRPCVPEKIEQIDSNEHKLRVTARMQTGELVSEDYDTVLFAIGRDSCTDKIGLEKVGVTRSKNGKLPAVNEQTNVPNIYAIGDVLEGKPELTPVAIEAGILLARRLFGGSNTQCDYTFVPTTVFTPLEYGAIGFSEEKAIETYGEADIEVYHSSLNPLEWTVTEREKNVCYAKIICLISENERVIGFHYLGPNAGEVTQGFALGMKLGATKADFDRTIGIHPTTAEIFTTLKVTKRSQQSTDQAGC